jgi:tetratricopeptide (TPR) repeat protein
VLNDEKNLELVKMRADIERHFISWIEHAQNPDYLLPSGLPLLQANDLLSTHADDMPGNLAKYIEQSNDRATAKARRFKATVMAVICVLTVLLIVAGIYYFRAEKNLDLALGSVDGLTEEMAVRLQDVEGMSIDATRSILSRIDTLVNRLEKSNDNETIAARINEMSAAMHFANGKMYRRYRVDLETRATEEIEMSLKLRKRLYSEAPDDPIRASRYADSLELWGDQLRELPASDPQKRCKGKPLKKADEAIGHYREALKLREHLAKEYPDHARALSWEIGRAQLNARIGDAYKDLCQPQDAEDFYHRALAISVPGYLTQESEEWMNELGWNLRKLGGIRKDSASDISNRAAAVEAITALEGSLCVRRRRYERKPDEIKRARDVSFALVSLGEALVLQGRYEEAESYYYEALHLRHKFFRSDLRNGEYSRDLFFSYAEIAEFEAKRGNWEHAYVHAMDALDHLKRHKNIESERGVLEREAKLKEQVQEIRSRFDSPLLNDFDVIALSRDDLYQQFFSKVTKQMASPERKVNTAALNPNSEDKENQKDCATRIRATFGSNVTQGTGG